MTKTNSDSDDECDSSRLENLHWCSCQKCVIGLTMTLEEAKCCREIINLLGKKIDGLKCITENEDFEVLCINRTVLETACIRHRRYKNRFEDWNLFTNK